MLHLTRAQDGLDLPAALYVLTTDGQVQRFGVGIEGLSTVTPDDQTVLDFGVAPDDNWIAFRTEKGLYFRNIYTGQQEQVEDQRAGQPVVTGHNDTIAWSPAGDAVAYATAYGARVRFAGAAAPGFIDLSEGASVGLIWSPFGDYLAAEAEDNIWWLYRREGQQLILTGAIPSSLGLTWVSRSELVFAPAEGGLIKMDLASANYQTVLLDNSWNYALPYLLPDGTIAAIGREKNDVTVPEGSGRLIGLAPGAARSAYLSETPVEISGLRWAPGGQFMIAAKGGALALIIAATGAGLTLPISDVVSFNWGPRPLERVNGLSMSSAGYFLAALEADVRQIWRLPKDGAFAVPLTTTSVPITLYAVSPDDRHLAYVTADNRLWLQSGEEEPRQLVTVSEDGIGDLAFSLDSQQIAYADLNSGFNLISAESGDPILTLPDSTYTKLEFAPNLNALLLESVQSDQRRYYSLLDLNSQEALAVGQFEAAIWLQNGRLLAYHNQGAQAALLQQVVVIDPATMQPQDLASIPYPARILDMRALTGVRARLVIGSYQTGPRAVNVVDVLTTRGDLSGVGAGGFMVNPALSPDGRFLAGQTHDGGPLTIRDLETGQQVVIDAPPRIALFRWG
jgi:WD40 repeat protein